MKTLCCGYMRKKIIGAGLTVLGMVFTLIFITSIPAHATLIDNGDGTITDSDTNLVWLQNANLAATDTFGVSGILSYFNGRMNWTTAGNWIAAMNATVYLGHSDWSLPTAPLLDLTCSVHSSTYHGYNCTESQMGQLYYSSLGNVAGGLLGNDGPYTTGPFNLQTSSIHWATGKYEPATGSAWGFDFNNGYLGYYPKDEELWVWAVAPGGGVAAVPEPGTLLLLGSGMMGLLIWRRRLYR